MSKTTERIARKMQQVGACYANNHHKHIGPNDPGTMTGDAKPTYHVHGDAERPEQHAIMRFDNLAQLEGWLDARIACENVSEDEAYRIMGLFWDSIS